MSKPDRGAPAWLLNPAECARRRPSGCSGREPSRYPPLAGLYLSRYFRKGRCVPDDRRNVIPMTVDIETLATYPTESDDWLLTVAIGGVALFLSVLVVPWFLVAGYLVRAIRAGMAGATEPPGFDDWEQLLREGVVAGVIGLVYQLVPLVVFAVFVGGSALALVTGTDTGTGLGLLGLLGGVVVWWVLAVVFGYVGVAGIANYASEGTFAAGFDVDVIRTIVTSRAYLVAWAYVVALNLVVGVVTGVLNFVPVVGALAGLFVAFYALIIAGWLWGDGVASATGVDVATAADPGSTTA